VEIGLGPGHIVLDGDPAFPPPKGHSPNFRPNGCMDQDAVWDVDSGGSKEALLDGHHWANTIEPSICGDDAVFCQITLTTCFWATVCKTVRPMLSDRRPVSISVTLVYCGQTVGWIKMKFGVEVGLDPGQIVLDGDPAIP